MREDLWRRSKDLLASALERPAEQREEFVRAACAGDGELSAEVLKLLAHRDRAGSFLEPPGEGQPEAEEEGDMSGRVVAGRYRLGRLLGSGGYGVVHEAHDALSGATVAVKLFRAPEAVSAPTVRREVATLRWLRLPGVVQLLDEGIDQGHAFLVTEFVEGTPFPGQGNGGSWRGVAVVARALLETLVRLHWAGIFHCDLKPSNVLVTKSGVPVILDLGIASGPSLGAALEARDEVAGTPRYVAPERFAGAVPDARGDIYAVGVMIYDAILGPPRSPGLSWLFAPLLTGAPKTPLAIAALVDRMVAGDPALRPASAIEVLSALQAGEPSPPASPPGPLLGPPAMIGALAQAGHAGRSVDLVGLPGSGKSRCLREAAALLAAEGIEAVVARAAPQPFATLLAALPAGGDELSSDLEVAREQLGARLRGFLERGGVLFVDDWERVDRWSASLFREAMRRGCIARARTGASGGDITMAPLGERDLRPLFKGPDRLHHLREDAARELWQRTGGWPAAVIRETEAWTRAGVARPDRGLLVVSRRALERLHLGPRVAAPEAAVAPLTAPGDAEVGDVLVCVDVAREFASEELVGEVTKLPRWRVRAHLDELVRLGAVRKLPDGGYEPLVSTDEGHAWPKEKLATLHDRVAAQIPEGHRDRLRHLLAGHAQAEAVREAVLVADRHISRGMVAAAESTLVEGLRMLRQSGVSTADEETFLALLLRGALLAGTPTSLDLVLYHVARAGRQTALIAEVADLARAAQLALQGDAVRSLELTRNARSADLEVWRHAIRCIAAAACPLESHRDVVAGAVRWAEGAGAADPVGRAARCEWVGWLRYREGRYPEAARLHAEAAALAANPARRASALLNAAWASLETFDFDAVKDLAMRALAAAALCRHAHYEARAEILARSAAYRAGDHGEPDLELVEAVEMLGVGHLVGVCALNEAAIAWRLGRSALAQQLAVESARGFHAAGERWGGMLARCLKLVAGATPESGETEELVRLATECPLPGLSLQAIGLLGRAGVASAGALGGLASGHARSLDSEHHGKRREVLSVDEALA